MRDIVVDFTTVAQVLFDFDRITNIFLVAVFFLRLFFAISFDTIAELIEPAFIGVGCKCFLVALHLLDHDFSTKLLQEFVRLL